jgi:hypothetical protein
MTTEVLTEKAAEKGTYAFQVDFTDADDAALVPGSIQWTLTDRAGNTINDQSAVTVTPASSINVVLSGDDLALPKINDPVRLVLVEWDFTSSLGSNLPMKLQVCFEIDNMIAED